MSKPINALVVGAGNIGLRHIESLINSGQFYNITIVDPNNFSFDKIKKNDVNTKKINLEFYESIHVLEKNYDVIIIATKSNIRFSIFYELVKQFDTKNYILEKFLFDNPNEYLSANKLIKENGLNVWVNCTRRTWSLYKNIKSEIKNNKFVELSVDGYNWGLASNAIHFIDLFCWLLNSKRLTLDTSELKNQIFNSKRSGTIDFYGIIKAKVGKSKLLLDCKEGTKREFILKVKTSDKTIIVDEKKQVIEVKNNIDNTIIHNSFNIPMVSEMTSNFCKNIFRQNSCDLPTYEESSIYHLKLLNQLINRANEITGKTHSKLAIT